MAKTKRPPLRIWRRLHGLSFCHFLLAEALLLALSLQPLPTPPHPTPPVRLSSLLLCALSVLIALLKPPFAWHSHIILWSLRRQATSAYPLHKVRDGPVRSVSFPTSLCTSKKPTSYCCRVEAVVALAEWLPTNWPPHHLTNQYQVSTCVANIQSCDVTAFFSLAL